MIPPAKKPTDSFELIFEREAPIIPKGPFSRDYTPDFPFPSQAYIAQVGGKLKRTYPFEDSNSRLKIPNHHNHFKGFERHPRPSEFYHLLLHYFSGKDLFAEEATVIEDLKVPLDTSMGNQLFYGEFLSAAIELERGLVTLYIDPQGLVCKTHQAQNGEVSHSYSKGPKFMCLDALDFRVKTGKKENIPLDEVDGLPEYLFGYHFDELPEPLQTGPSKIHLFPADTIAPLGFGTGPNNPHGYFDMVTYHQRGSRGVIEKRVASFARCPEEPEARYTPNYC